MPVNILLTGPPGIGKTTAIKRVVERLVGLRLVGFTTDEVRVGGRRRGFKVLTLDGREGILADVAFRSRWRVGRYGVDLEGFERLVCPILEGGADDADAAVIDEIGKMECFSPRFCRAVERLADAHIPMVATIGARGGGLIADLKRRSDATLIVLSQANRDQVPAEVAALVREAVERP